MLSPPRMGRVIFREEADGLGTASSWSTPHLTRALDALAHVLAHAEFPSVPPGFELIDKRRSMRIVMRGTLSHDLDEPIEVVVKWHAPTARGWRSGRRAAREGDVMRRIAQEGIAVPEVLGWRSRPAQMLVTRWIPDLVAIPTLEGTGPELRETLCELIANARQRGLWHRDLHLGNVALRYGKPLLLDFGGAVLGRREDPLDYAMLSLIHHSSLDRLSTTSQIRWLKDYGNVVDIPWNRARLCETINHVSKQSARMARRYRRGRDRRATRSGRHFQADIDRKTRVRSIRACRNVPDTLPELTRACYDAVLDEHEYVPVGKSTYELVPFKSSARGPSVFRITTDEGTFAVKYFEPVPMFRRTRVRRAFITAFALTNRYLPAPRALSCRWATTGEGILISEWIDAPDLHAFFHDPSSEGFSALPERSQLDLLHHVGRTLRHLHECALTHRDLKAPNLLVRVDANTKPAMWFVDLDGLRVRRRAPGWARRAKDLARLDASLPFSDLHRRRLFESYLGVWPRSLVSLDELDAMITPHVERKRGPSGNPR